MTVFIMAAGEQRRFGSAEFKQLLNVGNDTLLERMVRHSQQRGEHDIWLVTHHALLGFEAGRLGIRCFDPGEARSEHLAGNLAATKDLWRWSTDQPTVFLLGDVFYSYAVMDRIFSDPGPLRFFGNEWEFFAAVIWPSNFRSFLLACQQVAANPPPGGGKMRKVYQVLAGLPTDGSVLEPAVEDYLHLIGQGRPNVPYPDGALLAYVGDETRDFDSLEDYQKFTAEDAHAAR